MAFMAWEEMASPRTRLKRNIQSFIPMDTARMATASQEKDSSSGWSSFSRELRPSSKPISRMAMATSRPLRYSIRPCPKGCSSSAACPASRKPISVITDEAASDRLFNPSATTAIEPVSSPAPSFPRHSRVFSRMPTPPASVPHRWRTSGAVGSAPPRQRRVNASINVNCLLAPPGASAPADLFLYQFIISRRLLFRQDGGRGSSRRHLGQFRIFQKENRRFSPKLFTNCSYHRHGFALIMG